MTKKEKEEAILAHCMQVKSFFTERGGGEREDFKRFMSDFLDFSVGFKFPRAFS